MTTSLAESRSWVLCSAAVPAAGCISLLLNQFSQRRYISDIVAGLVNRRFRDESGVRQSRIVQQAAEWLQANASFSDMLMPIELRSPGGFGVIAMPDVNVLQADGFIQLFQSVL